MDFALAAGDLASVMKRVKGCIPSRSTIPVVGCFLFDAAPGKLTITGTSISMESSASVPSDVAGAGSVAVPSSILFGIVDRLPRDNVVCIKTNEAGNVDVVCGRANGVSHGRVR